MDLHMSEVGDQKFSNGVINLESCTSRSSSASIAPKYPSRSEHSHPSPSVQHPQRSGVLHSEQISTSQIRQSESPVSSKFFQRFFCESLRDGRKWTARCVLCSAVVSAAAGVNSNFKRHLRRYHPIELELFEASQNLIKQGEGKVHQEDVSSSNVIHTASTGYNFCNSLVDPLNSPDQSASINECSRKWDIDDAILLMLCVNYEPFEFVESEGFRHFLKVALPWYEAPSVRRLYDVILPTKSNQLLNLITFFLNSIDYCSLGVNILPFKNNDYILEITCHFIDKTYLSRKVVLMCQYLHNEDSVEAALEELLVRFCTANKIVYITLDVAAENMLQILPGYFEDKKPTLGLLSNSEEAARKHITIVKKMYDILLPCSEVIRVSSVVHTLQSILKNGLDHPQVVSLIRKATFIISISNGIIDSLPDAQHTSLKWLYQYRSLTRLNEKLLNDPNFQSSLHLSDDEHLGTLDVKALCELITAIQPFEDYTNVLQKSAATSGMVIPAIIDICNQLTDLSLHFTTWVGAVVEHLKEVLNQYFADVMNESIFQLASVLDPRFKLAWCLDNSMKNSVRSLLIAEASLISKANRNDPGGTSNSVVSSKNQTSIDDAAVNEEQDATLTHKRPKLFSSLCLGKSPARYVVVPDSYEQEVSLYLDEPVLADIESKPLEYWRFQCMRFPVLAILATKVFCIPTSLDESDEMTMKFQKLHQYAQVPATKSLENILFIRKNAHLLGF